MLESSKSARQVTNETPDEIRERFEKAGQGGVFRFWTELPESGRANLISQAREIDLDEVDRLVDQFVRPEGETAVDFSSLEPAPYLPFPDKGATDPAWEAAREEGERALRAGRVAAFTVAGGQGTRLGYEGPKGTFPVTPVKRKPLFQVFAEKILASRREFGQPIPWLIMTSHANHDDTIEFFRANEFFGLAESEVVFFRQGRMPAVDREGKILLESKDSIAMSPDGHGGSLRALCRSGAVETLRARGIDTISYFQVDNPLVQAVDPVFIGFHIQRGSDMSSKMIPKAYPKEKVGVFVVRQGKMEVVEYSDLPDELAEQRDENGNLRFLSGSIAIHILSVGFVDRMGGGGEGPSLPFHRALKKVAAIDERGEPLKPGEPNGIKFEMFVFDALPFAENPVVLETRREDEFSPVKNADGVDSPETCRRDQLKQFARWLRAAGVEIETGSDGVPREAIEVGPLFATDERTFCRSWGNLTEKPAIRAGLVLEP